MQPPPAPSYEEEAEGETLELVEPAAGTEWGEEFDVNRLSPDEQELLQAAYEDERPLQELADEAGQTYKALESRLGRLRQKLKTRLLSQLRNE